MQRNWILTAVLGFASLAGCEAQTDDAAGTELGSFSSALRYTDSNGMGYRLSGQFRFQGNNIDSTVYPGLDDTMVQELPPGDYTVTLGNWYLYEQDPVAGESQIAARLVSPNVQAFTITQDAVTPVNFGFETNAGLLTIATGQVALSFEVDAGSANGHYIFASSTLQTGGSVGSLAQADALCQSLGDSGAVTAPGARTWVALMSDSVAGVDARDRVAWNGPLLNMAGTVVAPDASAWPLSLSSPVQFDENGAVHQGNVKAWTGSYSNGLASGNDCDGWTNDAGVSIAGRVYVTGDTWFDGLGGELCSASYALYCVSL